MSNSDLYTVDELVDEICKYKSYFGENGGVTASGGEPLLQIDFIIQLFKKLKKLHIHTACDTSGITFDSSNPKNVAKHLELLKVTDLFLLDIKHMNEEKHTKLTGKGNKDILSFARFLSDQGKPIWIRHVVIPGITLIEEDLLELRKFIRELNTVEHIELLPYHTMGTSKYQRLGIAYPLKDVLPPTKEQMEAVYQLFE